MSIESLKAIRREFSDITCIRGCTDCCPDCKHLTRGTGCAVHPDENTRASIRDAIYEKGFGVTCWQPPGEWFVNGIYCPPCIQRAESILGLKIKSFYDRSGQRIFRDHEKIINALEDALMDQS
jgi:hypothetical protein